MSPWNRIMLFNISEECDGSWSQRKLYALSQQSWESKAVISMQHMLLSATFKLTAVIIIIQIWHTEIN